MLVHWPELKANMSQAVTIRSELLGPGSIPERELLGFVSAGTELLGSQQSRLLTEIWLDELASMEAMPEPTSTRWELVTVGAWVRLARRLFEVCLTGDCP